MPSYCNANANTDNTHDYPHDYPHRLHTQLRGRAFDGLVLQLRGVDVLQPHNFGVQHIAAVRGAGGVVFQAEQLVYESASD